MKKLRLALIGLSHVHVHGMINTFSRYPDEYEWVGMADVPPYTEEELREHFEKNVPKKMPAEIPFWDDYKELLKQNIDIAIVCCQILKYPPVVAEILGMDISVIIEKPMALSYEDAMVMYKAHKKSRGELIVNWPVAWFPAFRKAKELADDGAVGKVMRIQYRTPSTQGPYILKNYDVEELKKIWWFHHDEGGGSISDYGGYGFTLSTWFLGKTAKRVAGIKKNYMMQFAPDIEDFSSFMIDFGDEVGYVEGSWSTMSNAEIPTGPIVYGTEGVIVADRFSPEVKVYNDFLPYHQTPPANAVYRPEPIRDNLATNVSDHFLYGKPLYEVVSADFNMKAVVAYDAGIRSCTSGRFEDTKDPFDVK